MIATASRHYYETQLPLSEDPLLIAARLADSGLHESYVVYENGGSWSYAGGARAELTLDRDGARLTQEGLPEVVLPWSDTPLRLVSELLAQVEVPSWRAYGWAAFELSYVKEGGRRHLGDERLMHLVVPRAEVRFGEGHALLRAADQAALDALVDTVLADGPARNTQPRPLDVYATDSGPYRAAVRQAVDAINAGELHKVILSRVVEVPGDTDLTGTYVAGRRGNNPARSFMVNLGGTEAIGFSPEIVVQVSEDGRVVSQPLAGTRALTSDAYVNACLRADLFGSPKEVYEHAISVKTGADELLEVCLEGTVGVPEFMAVRERGSVQHLASRVTGRLAPGQEAWDAFGAVFPAVTASGVPKEAAYESIRRNEPETRGLYSGTVLTVDHSGAMDAALVLRSAYRKDGRTWLRAGAGIVGHSTPEREFEETCEKLDSVARYLVPAATGEQR
ncbi:salicylate synthase [Streptomyces spiroverticillatus]|uniref:Salicylate synthase n=1 Tax=Streptomyces finlayi TaxID=67296 RepID=A0A918X4E5_9ACTN|nr:salicylate synthase [Streptomyces finlayi]GHA31691.1 salicylate synthase [Streptomyces spiroverticillatus]GHD10951.1 salicylate synthase [Streptomyces finlayi]